MNDCSKTNSLLSVVVFFFFFSDLRHEFAQIPRGSEGQGSLAWCSPWGHRESDMTLQPKNKTM